MATISIKPDTARSAVSIEENICDRVIIRNELHVDDVNCEIKEEPNEHSAIADSAVNHEDNICNRVMMKNELHVDDVNCEIKEEPNEHSESWSSETKATSAGIDCRDVKEESEVAKDCCTCKLCSPKLNDEPFYTCDVCSQLYRCRRELSQHERIHVTKSPHSCDICQLDFSSQSELKKHIDIHIHQKIYPCPTCSKSFLEWSQLKFHFLAHISSMPFNCSMCSKTWKTLHKFNMHKCRKRNGAKLKCMICQVECKARLTFKVHLRSHSKQLMSTLCQAVYKRNRPWLIKLAEDKKERVTCDCCGKRFPSTACLKHHLLMDSS